MKLSLLFVAATMLLSGLAQAADVYDVHHHHPMCAPHGWRYAGYRHMYIQRAMDAHIHDDGACAELSFSGGFHGPRLLLASGEQFASLASLVVNTEGGSQVQINANNDVDAVWVHEGCTLTTYQYENYGVDLNDSNRFIGGTYIFQGARILDNAQDHAYTCELRDGSAPGAEYSTYRSELPANKLSSLKCSCGPTAQ